MGQHRREGRPGRRQALISLSAGVLLAGLMASGVSAAPPYRSISPLPPEIEDYGCGYLIVATFPVNNQYWMDFVDSEGNTTHSIVAGGLIVLFTNPNTGESIKVSISGPTHFFYDGNRFGGQGTWVLLPEGTLTVAAGQNDGSQLLRGTTILDVCDALPNDS